MASSSGLCKRYEKISLPAYYREVIYGCSLERNPYGGIFCTLRLIRTLRRVFGEEASVLIFIMCGVIVEKKLSLVHESGRNEKLCPQPSKPELRTSVFLTVEQLNRYACRQAVAGRQGGKQAGRRAGRRTLSTRCLHWMAFGWMLSWVICQSWACLRP